MIRTILFSCSFLLVSNIFAQNTVGLLSFDPASAAEGYNLFFPHNQGNVYLLDNCGRIVHEWEDSIYVPGNGYTLTEAGELYRCAGRGAASNSYIHAGGGGEVLQIKDWDNNILWEWAYNDSTKRLHHDLAVMPNGNVLAIAWERKTVAEAIAAGRDTGLLTQGALWPDQVIEVEPIGSDSANIVWQWNAWDHLVQDFDNSKANFGDPASSPRRIDLNYALDGRADWLHSNAIDYIADRDQIILSVPHFDEIWIIDHSTTTSQAASSFGGASGYGGDLIYRWGNPRAYRQGDTTDQKLFFQHDAHFADQFLSPLHPDYGKMMVFNNRAGPDFSTVHSFVPPWNMYMFDYTMTGSTWGPADFDWTYQRPDSTMMYSTGLSSVQRLENGNTLICVGRFGYNFEITPTEEIVWEYKNPMISGIPIAQGTMLSAGDNLHFRMHRYPSDFSAFSGKDLSSKGYIESNPDTTCPSLPNWIPELGNEIEFISYPNPSSGNITIRFGDVSLNGLRLSVSDMLGRKVMEETMTGHSNRHQVDVSNLTNGEYIICIMHEDEGVLGNFRLMILK